MAEPRHLEHAPITEALIDFRVKAWAGFRAEKFANLRGRLAARFPKVEERRGLQATFGVIQRKGQPPVMEDLGLQGYFFKASDEKTIAQFRVDGFTVNRLHPYTSWEKLFPEAMDLWRLYASFSKPEVITRLAVRYINRIVLPPGAMLPLSTNLLRKYLEAAPVIPPEVPQSISGFLTRVTVHDPKTEINAHVAQALETNAPGQQLVVILDIDAFKQREFTIDDPAIEQTFVQLRAFKNLIFFNSLSDSILEELG